MLDVCINENLRDDELCAVLAKLECEKDKEVFGLVYKSWLHLQSTEQKKLYARAGPHMLRKIAARFTRLNYLYLSQSISRSFYLGVTDSDLSVIVIVVTCLHHLYLRNCKDIKEHEWVDMASDLGVRRRTISPFLLASAMELLRYSEIKLGPLLKAYHDLLTAVEQNRVLATSRERMSNINGGVRSSQEPSVSTKTTGNCLQSVLASIHHLK